MESLFARLPEQARLSLYATPATLPEDFSQLPERIRKIAQELGQSANGKLFFEQIDPSQDPELERRLAEEYGIRPLAVDLFGRETFYLDAVLEAGGKIQRIIPRSDLGEGDLRAAIESAVRRATPGQLKTVGLFTETPVAPPPNPQIPPQFQPPPPRPDYSGLERLLQDDYEVTKVDLADGIVPETIDVLVVGKPGALAEKAQFAIDQYLMRGGKLVVLGGRFTIDPQRGGLSAKPHESPAFEMLETWGVTVEPSLVMDTQNAPFPIPVQEQRGMFRVQRIQMLPYPFFPDIRRDGFLVDHPALAGIQNVTTPWASPLRVSAPDGVEAQTLLSSSTESWLNTTGSIEPDLRLYPETGFAPGPELESQVLAVSLSGSFPSHFTGRPSPLFTADGEQPPDSSAEPDSTGRTIKRSLPDARLIVLGSAEIASDLLLQLANQPGGEVHRGDLQLVQNLVDWSVEDTDLLTIRSTGAFARTLRPMTEAEARTWEIASYGVTLALLVAATLIPRQRRMNALPISLPDAEPSS